MGEMVVMAGDVGAVAATVVAADTWGVATEEDRVVMMEAREATVVAATEADREVTEAAAAIDFLILLLYVYSTNKNKYFVTVTSISMCKLYYSHLLLYRHLLKLAINI